MEPIKWWGGKSAYLITVFLAISNILYSQTFEDLLGKWRDSEDGKKQIEFFKAADGFIYGKFIGETEQGGIENGKIVFQKCWFGDQTKTWKGIMQPPGKNIEMELTIHLEGIGKLRLIARKFFINKTFYFLKTE